MFTILNLMERRSSNRFVGLTYSVIKSDAYFDSVFNEFVVNKSKRTKKKKETVMLVCEYLYMWVLFDAKK